MRFYRVYALDALDNIENVHLIEAQDDRAVIEHVMAAFGAMTTEVWDQRRLVARLPTGRTALSNVKLLVAVSEIVAAQGLSQQHPHSDKLAMVAGPVVGTMSLVDPAGG